MRTLWQLRCAAQSSIAYLVVPQSNPTNQILRYGENVSQHVDFKFIICLVDSRFEQCLQLMQAIFDFQFRLWIDHIPVFVGVRDGRTIVCVREAQAFGGCTEQA